MEDIQNKIQSWLQQPKIRRFVCVVVSFVVGTLFCYGRSYTSSFDYLFSEWKILLYIVLICLAKEIESFTSPYVPFFVVLASSLYSYFYDNQVLSEEWKVEDPLDWKSKKLRSREE
ncbi:uncharacterized protein LOC114916826 [Cajanus cajan]|uniref:uncharacterized protein LOC114916826 n=1 Tax=Cajanus cajan TaxID=3821 RepID=UPI0010FBB23D|nr:uncharacterized protein LOC114916826 [Cajanus cajan]